MDAISFDNIPLPASIVLGAIAAMVYLLSSARHRQGTFSMIDGVIVVATMGIVSAATMPFLGAAQESAKRTTLQHNLRMLRTQIELYKLEHGDRPPVLFKGGFPQLTHATDAQGTPGPPGKNHPYGPYLLAGIPPNPYTGIRTVELTETIAPRECDSAGGWLYHQQTGRITPALPEELAETEPHLPKDGK